MFGRMHYAAIFFDTKNIKAIVDTPRRAFYRVCRVHGHEDSGHRQRRARTCACMEVEAKPSGGARLVRPRERWDRANGGVRLGKSDRCFERGGRRGEAQAGSHGTRARTTPGARSFRRIRETASVDYWTIANRRATRGQQGLCEGVYAAAWNSNCVNLRHI